MDQQGIHYRVGGKLTHAGCEMLPGGNDIPYIVIHKIEYKDDEFINGRKENGVWIAYFAKDNGYTDLPMILNVTNRKRIAKLYPEVEGCINLLTDIPVCLTKEICRDVQDGGDTYGLRISKKRPVKPAAPKKEQLSEDKMQTAIDFLAKGGSIDAIEKKYQITAEQREYLLTNAAEI